MDATLPVARYADNRQRVAKYCCGLVRLTALDRYRQGKALRESGEMGWIGDDEEGRRRRRLMQRKPSSQGEFRTYAGWVATREGEQSRAGDFSVARRLIF